MACKPELKHTFMDMNTIHFEAVCSGKCDAAGLTCSPVLKGLSEHDKRYTVTIAGGGKGGADAIVHAELDIAKDDEVVVEASCMCGDHESGERDAYHFHHNIPATGDRIIEDLATLGHLFRRIFL